MTWVEFFYKINKRPETFIPGSRVYLWWKLEVHTIKGYPELAGGGVKPPLLRTLFRKKISVLRVEHWRFHSWPRTFDRSSRRRCSIKSNIYIEKTLALESLFNKNAGLHNLIKKGLQHWCFPVNMTKFLRTTIWRTASNGCFWLMIPFLCLNEQYFFPFFDGKKLAVVSLEFTISKKMA